MKPMKIVLLLVVAAGGSALYRAGQRVAPHDAPLPSGEAVQYSALGRVRQGVGAVGSLMVRGWVKSLVQTSEKELADMKVALQKKQGRDGDHARTSAKMVVKLDSAAMDELLSARPIAAVNHAMKARDYVSVAKRNVSAP
jgi:hypothetical protein